jgi:ribosomal protein S19E (S16A)
MSKATASQLSALKWLINRNGDGVFGEKSNNSVLIAGGERAPVMRGTWSKLEALGLVERYDKRRLRVTDEGRLVRLDRVEESYASWADA